jgi:cyclase
MFYKRIIFALLFFEGNFYLSRNFRLQKVGDIDWVKKNYDFGKTCNSLDELIILNVKKNFNSNDKKVFFNTIKRIKKDFFLPLTLGGGIRNFEDAKEMFEEGADKVVINTLFYNNFLEIETIANTYGNQSLTLMIDYKQDKGNQYFCYKNSGQQKVELINKFFFEKINKCPCGDVIFNSIDLDGSGMGPDINFTISQAFKKFLKPALLMGGFGNPSHILKALNIKKISGIVTANLFNFLGNGLIDCRKNILIYKKYLASF